MKAALLLSDQSRRAKQPRIGEFRRTLLRGLDGKDQYLYIWQGKLYDAKDIDAFNKTADWVCRQHDTYGNLIIPILLPEDKIDEALEMRAKIDREHLITVFQEAGFTAEQHKAKIAEMQNLAEGAISAGAFMEGRLLELHALWYQQWRDEAELTTAFTAAKDAPPLPTTTTQAPPPAAAPKAAKKAAANAPSPPPARKRGRPAKSSSPRSRGTL